MHFGRTVFGATLVLASASTSAQMSIGGGAEFTTGKYGTTETTDQLYIPFTARFETGRWRLRATIPYLIVSGPANVIGGGEDRIPVSNSGSGSSGSGSGGSGSGSGGSGSGSSGGGGSVNAGRSTASGLGDIVTSASYSVLDEASSAIGLDLGGRIKFGTADEAERLGTGENDFSVQADLYKPLGDFTVFATLGYRWYGDPPGIELRDVPYWALGASYRLEGGSVVGFAYDHRPRIVDGGFEISELSLFWSKRFSREWKLQLYAIAGLSDGSPDAGVGAVLDYRF
jgi:hypothetical protein